MAFDSELPAINARFRHAGGVQAASPEGPSEARRLDAAEHRDRIPHRRQGSDGPIVNNVALTGRAG